MIRLDNDYDTRHDQAIAEIASITGLSKSAIDKHIQAASIDINSITTAHEADDAYKKALDGSPLQLEILAKWLSLADDFWDYIAFDKTVPPNNPMKYEALAKWEQFCRDKLLIATTDEAAEEVYCKAPDGSPVKTEALSKWLSLASTTEDLDTIYHEAPDGNPLQSEAIAKMYNIKMREP